MYTTDNDISSLTEPGTTCKNVYRLLEADFILHVNTEKRIVSLLYEQQPTVLTQQQFTRTEWMLLTVLLDNYPYYAPHEMLLSSITSLSVEECRKRIQETRLQGAEELRRELKPVYRALCSIRTKLRKLHPTLTASLVRDVGYLLTASFQEGPIR